MTINPATHVLESNVFQQTKPSAPVKALLIFACISLLAAPIQADESVKKPAKQVIPPALKAVDTDGKKVELAKLKGKVVLIDFWATWCSPCLKEIPLLKKIYAKLHEEGFEIIGVANNEKDDLEKHFKKQSMPWSTIADGENVISEDYEVLSWPTAILVNAKGEQIGKNLKTTELLDRIIKELKLEPSDYKSLRAELEKAHKAKEHKEESE